MSVCDINPQTHAPAVPHLRRELLNEQNLGSDVLIFHPSVQNYYQNRPAMPSAAPRVQTSNGPRPVGPAHVYPSSSQMMMISQQQLSFAGSPQGYFLPGQVGSQDSLSSS